MTVFIYLFISNLPPGGELWSVVPGDGQGVSDDICPGDYHQMVS